MVSLSSSCVKSILSLLGDSVISKALDWVVLLKKGKDKLRLRDGQKSMMQNILMIL